MTTLNESIVEEATLSWFWELGYQTLFGPDIAYDGPKAERTSYSEVILPGRLKEALIKINQKIPSEAIDEAIRKITLTESPNVVENNRRFHRFLTDGVDVEYRSTDRRIVHDKVWLVDFVHPENNNWLAVNQFTIVENNHNRRPDIVVFVNGLPLGVIELKNPTDENATVRNAFHQLQTYKAELPSLFPFNEVLIISDGLGARVGSLTADWERFMPWRTIEGEEIASNIEPQLEVLIKGIFDKSRFLDLIRSFVTFEVDGAIINKKIAGYHQFHAVNKAINCTTEATSPSGDRRIGVIWHTQGSGKSLSMAFYAGKIIQHPKMVNPTIVIMTDRNDLDDQLFGTFSLNKDLLRQIPVQAESRADLREKLKVASGGVVFTTIQKFFPEQKGDGASLLSERRNIVVIADEAHRSQYDFIDGFARHMRDALPNASFIGFTGTPIEKTDRNTKSVFGDYIDVYDIQRAVEDGATVRIYYEGRLAKIELKENERPKIDPEFEEVTEGEEVQKKEKLKSKWARLESLVGAEKRIALVAKDLVEHFEKRLEALEGKAMVVCMSRRICVDLYKAITKLRPQWHDEDDTKGAIKIVMTGSASDLLDWQPHIRNKERREGLAKRFKNAKDPFRIVLVRDMWLTGFDVPSLHTMYVDKPMSGHNLMQAIARVNRVFKDKPGGLVVDYLGLADNLKKALADYTESGGKGKPTFDQADAVALVLEKYEIVCGMLHGFDYAQSISGKPEARLKGILAAMDFIAQKDPKDGKDRYLKSVTELSKAFALAVPHSEALKIRDDVGFFQAVRAGFVKTTVTEGKSDEDLDVAVRQIVSKAISADQVIDVFSAAGLKKPDISILSDEFLAEISGMPQRNLALELLQKLLNDEIKVRSRKNLVQARTFTEKLEVSIQKYKNRSIETAQVIDELIKLAKEMREANRRGENIGLSEQELAFYDALEVNDSAVKVLGDDTLKTIARKLVDTVKKNATIDWTLKESARAKLRTMVRRLLREYGYPPDKQEQATKLVLEQAELLGLETAA